MKRALLMLALCAGCHHIRYTNSEVQPGAPVPQSMHHNFVFGLVEAQGTQVDDLCPQGFASVEHQEMAPDVALQILQRLLIVNLDMWEPSTVQVTCAAAPAPEMAPHPSAPPPPVAPPAPPAPSGKPAAVVPAAPPAGKGCLTSADCKPGEFCHDRGDGVSRCMARGSTGAFCSQAQDCSGGLACKDPGDGIKKCVGHGQKGDPCVAGTDCQAGLKCQGKAPIRSCE